METTINQRLKFLLEHYKMSARSFSRALGVADNNTQNYINPNPAMPKADYLEKVLNHFQSINPAWLLTGKGEPFLDDESKNGIIQTGNFNQAGTNNIQKVKGGRNAVVGANYGTAMQQNGAPAPDEKTLAALALAEREIQHLRDKLAASEALVASKEETISVLRAAFTRPN